MPYESTGDFLLNATPEEIQKMTEIFKTIEEYRPQLIADIPKTDIPKSYLDWCRIFNVN